VNDEEEKDEKERATNQFKYNSIKRFFKGKQWFAFGPGRFVYQHVLVPWK
jgi:hypothetical protein